ncbi:MAG: N-6 DNA methylase, partial [Bacteroidetes bacterium]|nr:N-6 DNA methylase [Bacteroidota bacterium]
KAPDYCFTVYGQRKFFVDAKKPSVNIKGDIAPAYQVRRYGWSARLPIAIVTDFEEFSIYDCSKKPNQTDRASVSRIKYITYNNYLDEFDFFWDTFAKENILKGRFDKYVQSDAKKRGTANVDDEFLKSIEEWRTYLATTIALRNKSLSEDEINYAVQKNIDRIIFLRICEDRGIEHYGDLKNAIKKGNLYQNLFELYRFADEKYNSGLFDFREDTITPLLTVDNKVVKNIISDLYYPVSPYEFSVLPADILGSVYERFLGKTIRLTKAHHAKIEEKPEVRKAGGVYYTPKYIVDYIVENTAGKLIKDKKPKDIEKIKIVDPACGSGSFLIGAYQYLLNWHLQYYTENPPQKKPVRQSRKGVGGKNNPLTPDGNLTTAEKKRILLNNIYGVDIDAQAVEVTKLNLLLKALEGETNASISKQLTFFNERVLPNLGDNIKCGNSLIGTDFYDDQLVLFPEQIKKINAFDWDKAFPEIFKNGGFDVVIGNPPYLKLTANNSDAEILAYYQKNFLSYSGGSSKNLFQLFLERVSYISPKLFSFIVPEALLTTKSNGKIREILLQNFNLNSIVTFDHFVFEDATIGTTIIVGEKNSKEKTKVIKIDTVKQEKTIQKIELSNGADPWDIYLDDTSIRLFKKVMTSSKLMCELVEMSKGMVVKNRKDILTQFPTKKSYPFLLGNCMSRYNYHYDKYAEYEKLNIIGGTRVLKKHLITPRLLIRRTGSYLCATYSDKQELIESTIYILRSEQLNLKFLLGLINSKLLSFYLSKRLVTNTQGFPQVLMGQLAQLPIISASEQEQKEIENLVDNLLQLNKGLQSTKLETQRQQLQRAIDHAENKIDKLVYKLYGLTEEEIGIVEK